MSVYGVVVVVTATRVKRTAARKRARVRVHARFSHRLFRCWVRIHYWGYGIREIYGCYIR